MSLQAIVWIALAWIGANAILPIFLNSIERQYQLQIDTIVMGSLGGFKWLLLRLFQLFLIILMLPSLVLLIFLEKVAPSLCQRKQYLRDLTAAKRATFEPNFPRILVGSFRAYAKYKKLK